MQFRATHVFAGISAAAFEALYFDEAFNDALCRHARLKRTLVSLTRDGNVLRRAVRIVPERTLPAPAAKLLGTEHFGYVEHVSYTYGALRGSWRIEPAVLADKVKSAGTLHFEPEPEADGVRRVVAGDVAVKIFGLGGTIERFVVADVQKSYDEAATFTAQYLTQHPPAA